MLVFVACIKHPDNSETYDEVWKMLNNTLFSVCNQQDKDFRAIVVCDKRLPLNHHEELINQYTEFIEVSFSSHSEEVLQNFNRLGNLEPPLESAGWWMRWEEKDFAAGRPEGYFHIANVFLNMGTKLLIGILAAKKYKPDYVTIFDGDDYVGADISAYVHSQPERNGWLMTYGYMLAGNKVAPTYAGNSFCGTGNVINYRLLTKFIGESVSQISTQNELFTHVDSEFLITLANHKKIKPYFEARGLPLLEFPTRSVLYQVAHSESSEHAMKIFRGKSTRRFKRTPRYGKIQHLSAPLIDYFNVLANSTAKVFCLGFHKTGTTSMELLLQDMGYLVASPYKNWDPVLAEALANGDLTELKNLTEFFDAFQDAPWFLFYKEFDRLYPGSKFILTTRDRDSWWKSFLNYFQNEHRPLFRYIYGFDNPVGHKEVFVERFEKHYCEVLKYFKDRPDDLLVVDISAENALTKISAFLGRSSSYATMPHANAALRQPTSKQSGFSVAKGNSKKLIKVARNRLVLMMKGRQIRKAPIVLGGSLSSGVDLILSFLSSHPHLYAIRKIELSKPKYHPLSQEVHRNFVSRVKTQIGVPPVELKLLNKKIVQGYLSYSAQRWVGANRLSVLVYQELLDYFGEGLRIINVVRDGRDVVVENDPKIIGRYHVTPERWVYDVREGMKFENHPQVLTIRYEDLAQKTEKTLKHLSGFLGESNVAPFLNYPKKAKIVEPGYWIGKWKQPQYADRVEQLMQTPGALECLRHYEYLG